jgi:hypothetical protein
MWNLGLTGLIKMLLTAARLIRPAAAYMASL